MKYLGVVLLVWLTVSRAGENLFVCKNASITLFSSAPMEDIGAVSNAAVSVYNASTGDLELSVPIRSFRFEKSLMQEHFNSEYMESDKFPKATFKGKINESVDVTKDGSYPVSVTGDLTVHGITQRRTINGRLNVRGTVVIMTAEFMVKCADHRVDIPTIVFYHIAESIQVEVSATYDAYNSSVK